MKALLTLISTSLVLVTLNACQAPGRMPLVVSPLQQAQMQSLAHANGRVVYHVVPDSKFGGWLIKQQKQTQPISSHRTKAEAVAAGKALAKSHALGQLIIHLSNGRIETEFTYGKDPANSAG